MGVFFAPFLSANRLDRMGIPFLSFSLSQSLVQRQKISQKTPKTANREPAKNR
jgi:hypothetical protein